MLLSYYSHLLIFNGYLPEKAQIYSLLNLLIILCTIPSTFMSIKTGHLLKVLLTKFGLVPKILTRNSILSQKNCALNSVVDQE